MTYLKYILIASVVIIVGLGVYFGYSYLKPKPQQQIALETSRPVSNEKPDNKRMTSKIGDVTTSGVTNDETLIIDGVFQIGDSEVKEIDGVRYVYVFGVLDKNGALSRVHLTEDQYNNLISTIANFRTNMRITVYLTKSDIGIKGYD